MKLTADSLVQVPVLFVEKIYCPFGWSAIVSSYRIENKQGASTTVVFVWLSEYVGDVASILKVLSDSAKSHLD